MSIPCEFDPITKDLKIRWKFAKIKIHYEEAGISLEESIKFPIVYILYITNRSNFLWDLCMLIVYMYTKTVINKI